MGPDDSLLFFWAKNGTSTWHTEHVPSDLINDPVSLVANGDTFDVAALASQNTPAILVHELKFYRAAVGTGTWHAETVAGPNTLYYASLSLTADDNAANISTAVAGAQLNFYWAADGTATWHEETVAKGLQ